MNEMSDRRVPTGKCKRCGKHGEIVYIPILDGRYCLSCYVVVLPRCMVDCDYRAGGWYRR